jgi:diaminohydroxyphosphoribosylaminopyrimidine deaminase/5-amino-6-(5-phosphoribosylamino)uracil reductase
MTWTDADLIHARAALAAAARGEGLASPNPMVGAVVVRDGVVVGSGYHVYDDLNHGEVVALHEAGERARGATMYVNLEPCCHHGRTPPCVDAMIKAGIARVVASIQDPAPWVDGRGFATLREAGVEVVVGPESAAAARLNERYLHWITTGRPFVHLKLAQTLDGRIAAGNGASKWITGEQARESSQELRRRYDAILIGVSTVVADDPALTYRGPQHKRAPLARVVLDPSLRVPASSKLVRSAKTAPVIVVCREDAASGHAGQELIEQGIEVWPMPDLDGVLDLAELLKRLAARQITSLIVEGGATTAGHFVRAGLVDKATFFVAPMILGGSGSVSSVAGPDVTSLDAALRLEDVEVRSLDRDLEITGYPRR